jgi:lipopolysaccharide export system protein LptC
MPTRANPAATLFPLLLAGLLAGMSYWLELASRAPTTTNDGKSRHDPDFIVKNFEVRRFDPQGNLQHTVVADLMRHYPDDDSTVVLSPRITYHRNPPTFINAREAQISSKGEHVTLIDDVRVTRAGVSNKPDTVLTTTRLEAWPDDEIAKSNVPVTITQGQTNVRGSGLSVDNKTSFYTLDGPVQGVFFRTATAQPAAAPQTVQVPLPTPAIKKPAAKPASKSKPKAKSKPKLKAKSSR